MQSLIFAMALFIAVAQATPVPSNIMECLAANNFKTFVDQLTSQNVADTLKGAGPFTVFAPSDEAFTALTTNKPMLMKHFKENPEMLKKTLSNHIISKKIMPGDFSNDMMATPLSGENLRINVYGTDPVKRVVTVNGAMVALPGFETANGMVYKINQVLTSHMNHTVADVLAKRPEKFSTLLKLLTAAQLTSTLQSAGSFTLFAPTDEAFKAVPEAKLAQLMANAEALKNLLLGHLIRGTYYSSGLANAGSLSAANGVSVKTTVGPTVMIEQARVVEPNMVAVNGVVHGIDKVNFVV